MELSIKCPKCGGLKFSIPVIGEAKIDFTKKKKGGLKLSILKLEFDPVIVCENCSKPLKLDIEDILNIDEYVQELLDM